MFKIGDKVKRIDFTINGNIFQKDKIYIVSRVWDDISTKKIDLKDIRGGFDSYKFEIVGQVRFNFNKGE
jgi:hypothetical protein